MNIKSNKIVLAVIAVLMSGHVVEDVALHRVHLHGLLVGYVDALLPFDEHLHGVESACSLCGVRVVGRHVDAESRHCLLPGYGMVGHGVVEHAVHIEKHGLRAEDRPRGRVIVGDGFLYVHHCRYSQSQVYFSASKRFLMIYKLSSFERTGDLLTDLAMKLFIFSLSIFFCAHFA